MGKTQRVFYGLSSPLTEEEKEAVRENLKDLNDTQEAEAAVRAQQLIEKKKSVDFMTNKFSPYEDRILVYPDPIEEMTKGGLYKPDALINREKPKIGTVVAFGPGKNGLAMPLVKGQKIAYGSYAGTDFTIDEVKYLIMRFADCFGEVK